MPDPTFAIVIPSLHAPLIDQVIAALEQQTARDLIREIIVVGQDRYGRVPPSVRFVETPQPISAAAARNLGAQLAEAEYLLFLDADCLAAPDLIAQLAHSHAQGHTVVGGSMALEASNYWVLCDNLLSFTASLAQAPAGARPYLPSFNFSLPRELFAQVGGFDQRYPGASGEDMDLSLRLIAAGQTLYFAPGAGVLHRPARATAQAFWEHQRAFGRGYFRVQQQHRAMLRSPIDYVDPRWAGALLILLPVLASLDLIKLFAQNQFLWPRAHALAGMIWGRMAWYLGIVEALLVTHHLQRSAGSAK